MKKIESSFHRILQFSINGIFVSSIIFMASFSSCVTKKCLLCEQDNTTVYNIELKDGAKSSVEKKKFQALYRPVPADETKKELYVVDCDNQQPYMFGSQELEKFLKNNVYRIDTTRIKRITTSSDADSPPKIVEFDSLSFVKICQRKRNPFKIEMKLMAGARNFDEGGISIPGYNGGTHHEKELLGFGVGGTSIVVGAEVMASQRIFRLGNRNAFHLGLMTGFWPVDGSYFLPLAIHPRFSFNDITSPLWGSCNSLNLFADLGTAIDPSSKISFYTSKGLTSWFADGGIGFDLWQSRKHDLSFDLGYRLTNLALPNNADYQKCLEDAGIEQQVGYPERRAGQIIFRVGFTW